MTDPRTTAFAADVARDLARHPKQLQPKYLYDDLGSSLFDAICRLPWYRITRAETGLLAARAPAVCGPLGARPATVLELGCGNGEKIVVLVEALQACGGLASVQLVDISRQALDHASDRLRRMAVPVETHLASYHEGLAPAAARRRDGPLLVLFLGSNIGNFEPAAAEDLLRRIRAVSVPGDGLLLGVDLVKPEADLLLAYDDPLGVTAAFNRNLLVRLNRELGADVDLDAFAHLAVWRPEAQRIEMHLESRRAQTVRIPAAGCTVTLDAGERIWTESSYKYTPDQIAELAGATGFRIREQWIDDRARFALALLMVPPAT